MSYGVNQRTTEIGIRMAVGAEPKDVLKLILREGLFLAFVGTLLGVAGAFALSRFLSSVLFGVSATDPAIYLAAAGLLLIVAIGPVFGLPDEPPPFNRSRRCGTSKIIVNRSPR